MKWRSMKTAPRDGREIAVKFSIHMQTLVAVYNNLPEDYPGKPWYVLERWQVAESELAAWAPLPEWTGEVEP